MTDPDLKAAGVTFNDKTRQFECYWQGKFIVSKDGEKWQEGCDLKELFPENPDDLKPWHPLMGFGWDAVRLAEAYHYCGIADVKAMPLKENS